MTAPAEISSRGHDGEPKAKRRRIVLACKSCRANKNRCDGALPRCSACRENGRECQRDEESSDALMNVMVPKEYVSKLEERLRSVTQRLQRHDDLLVGHLSTCKPKGTPTHHPGPRKVSSGEQQSREEAIDTEAASLEDLRTERNDTDSMAMSFVDTEHSAYFGASSNIIFTRYMIRSIAVLWNVESVERPTIARDDVCSDSPPPQRRQLTPSSTSSSSSKPDHCTLPTAREMRSMLLKYFATTGLLFPFIHQQSFMQVYEKHESTGFSRLRRSWLGVLNMILALASSTDPGGQLSVKERSARSHVFYRRSWKLHKAHSRQAPCLETVQYLILHVLYLQGTQDSALTWKTHGLAVRSALSLGLYSKEASQMLDGVEREVRRRTWFTCYMLDRVLSLTFGRPPAIPDEYLMLDVPAPWPGPPLNGGGESHADDDLSTACFKASSQLYMIMGRCLAQLYSNNLGTIELHNDDLDTVSVAVGLRGELEQWRISLPTSLGILYEPAATSSHEDLRTTLTLRYFNLMLIIHRPLLCASIRHLVMTEGATTVNSPYPIQACMLESFHCVFAAERTISIVYDLVVGEGARRNRFGAWWFQLYYVFTAALVLVSRVLWAQRPGDNATDTVADSCRSHLVKAAEALHHLDKGNTMVSKCRDYINYLLRLCDTYFFERERPTEQAKRGEGHDPNTLQSWNQSGGDIEQLFTSELFNDALFLDLEFAPGEDSVTFSGFGK